MFRLPRATTVWSLALLYVGTADASDRRLQEYSMSCPDYQYYEESQERMRCSNCVYEECGCDGYPKNSSFCCTRSYSCDSDEDEEGGFTMGSILRQVWFIFIVMGVISTIIWRRRLRQRRMLMAQQLATLPHQTSGTNYANVAPAANGYPAAFGQPIQGQPIQGQPIAGVAVPAHAVAVAGAVPGYPTAACAAPGYPAASGYPSAVAVPGACAGAATATAAPMVTVQGRAVGATTAGDGGQPVIASATAVAGPAPVATATAAPPTYSQ